VIKYDDKLYYGIVFHNDCMHLHMACSMYKMDNFFYNTWNALITIAVS